MAQQHQETHMPDLRFVNVADLVLHEQHDTTRSLPLVGRLKSDGILKNPPVVAPLGGGDDRYVVLDGANRSTAAHMLELPHLVVQVVDYETPNLELSTWYHAVTTCSTLDLARILGTVHGMATSETTLLSARAALARREILSYIVWADGGVDALEGGQTLSERVELLNDLVDAYKQSVKIYRTQTDHVEQIQQYYEDVQAVIIFPRYVPAEIIELARNGARLPAGITRHVIPCRALRINIPLAKLTEPAPLDEKNAWLFTWMRQRMADRQARFYQESTWSFDE